MIRSYPTYEWQHRIGTLRRKAKTIFLAVAAALLTVSITGAAGPQLFYYARQERISLTPVADQLIVTSAPGSGAVVEKLFSGATFRTTNSNVYRVRGDAGTIGALRRQLATNPSIHTVQPVYKTNEGLEMGVADDFCVEFLPTVSQKQKADLQRRLNVSVKEAGPFFDLLRVAKGGDALAAANAFQESGLVVYAHPNFIVDPTFNYMPNDQFFNKQFNMHNTGQVINDGHTGTPDADIDAPEAWDITKGSTSIVVAVIDQGVTWTHPDLDANIWVNADEIADNGIDDDANGKIDDVRGWDFGSGDKDPSPLGDGNHGNACSGIVAAEQDNGEGTSGVAPRCKIMPIRIDGATNAAIANAIDYAWQNGAHILSNSWGYGNSCPYPDLVPAITAAIGRATTQGRGGLGSVVCFAAGNNANHAASIGGCVEYPANVNISGVLTVGASDRTDHQANYSPTDSRIDIAAPSHKAYLDQIANEGAEIWTTDIPGNSGYNPGPFGSDYEGEILPSSGTNYLSYTGRMGGTSSACPTVAGVAALVLSGNPGWTQTQVFNWLTAKADKVGGYAYPSGRSNELGYGRVNAFRSLDCFLPSVPTLVSAVPGPVGCTTNVTLTWSSVCPASAFEINVDTNQSFPAPWSANTPGNQLSTTYPGALPGTTYYWRVRSSNANGNSAWSSTGGFTPSVPVPVVTAPANGATVPGPGVTFSWTSCSSLSHTLQVATTSAFTTPVLSTTASSTSYFWPCAWNSTLYYWRVKACKNANCSAYAATRTFTVTAPPAAPTLVSPSNGVTVAGPNVTFSWSDACEPGGILALASEVEDAVRKTAGKHAALTPGPEHTAGTRDPVINLPQPYRLEVSQNTSFSPLVFSTDLTNTSYTWVNPTSSVYYWRVKRCEDPKCTPYSSVFSFTLPLKVLSPVGGENWAPSSSQTVTWQGGGTVKIELFAEGTPSGGSLVGPSVILDPAATGGSKLVTMPSDIATRRARIQISRPTGTPLTAYSLNPFYVVNAPPPNVWSFDPVDTPGHGWNQSDMCQNSGNGVHAVWLDLATEDLKLASQLDKTSTWVVSTIDAVDRVGSWPSIVRGPSDELHVAYYDHNVGTAKLYYKRRTNGVWSNRELVASVNVVQGDCSIVLDNSGVPMIAYDTGNAAGQDVKIVRRNPTTGVWGAFGNVPGGTVGVIPTNFGHHITLRSSANNTFWLSWLDLSGNPSLWIYNGFNWLAYNSYVQWAPGPYTDLSLALTPYHPYYPQLAYASAGATPGSQKLYFSYWAQDGSGAMLQRLIDDSPGTISSVDLEFGYNYWDVAIAYTGNGVAKLATGFYSETEWPNGWNRGPVDVSGDMDSQISLAYKLNGEKWLFYRDKNTTSMRAARPYWVDTTPPAASPILWSGGGCDSIFVNWQATGDDGNTGLAASYDLRWSGSPIPNDAAFNGSQAVPVALPVPGPSGTVERIAIYMGPCSVHKYFGLKIRDDAGNLSPLTSDPQGGQTACVQPPAQCWDAKPEVSADLPLSTGITGVWPNPTSQSLNVGIAMALTEAGKKVQLSVYDVAGRRVRVLRSEDLAAGRHVIQWDGRGSDGRPVGAGIYFVRGSIGMTMMTRRFVVIR